jgi:hypothetical protein
MARSSMFGRRVHIAGSIVADASVATPEEVRRAREFVQALVLELLRAGTTFVIPVDAEKTRTDGLPICFDWLVWDTIHKNLALRPSGAPDPLIVAVKHHKNEEQIPAEYHAVWSALRSSSLVQIESAAQWNMNSKRMEAQAKHGDVLIALGGGEGVLFLANLYHDVGKPVVPLNFKLSPSDSGARKIFEFGVSGANASRLFEVAAGATPHTLLNRVEVYTGKSTADELRDVLALLEALAPPPAFVVRLLNPTHEDYADVQNYFDTVVQPVMEDELGYRLVVVDGVQGIEHARIDQEIFAKLHRSRAVLADITGQRPNCYIELGYALGRCLPTMLMAKEGTAHPFDIETVSALHWKTTGSVTEKRAAFRTHWNAIQARPTLVPTDPLIL